MCDKNDSKWTIFILHIWIFFASVSFVYTSTFFDKSRVLIKYHAFNDVVDDARRDHAQLENILLFPTKSLLINQKKI